MYEVERDFEEIKAMRHTLHQIPEVAFDEVKTARFIADKLKSWGYDVSENIGKTGIVATLKSGESDKSIALRADMDALPMNENLNTYYKSKTSGRAHGCGHDGHSAMLLGAAKILAEKKEFNGIVTLIFQPAEETMAGAPAMIEDGLFDRFKIDAVFGMHNVPVIEEGTMLFSPGESMAAVDNWTISIRGRGAHGSMPEFSIDAVIACSSLVMSLQTIVSRSVAALDSAVVTVGAINAGTEGNIIADSGEIKISVRTIKEDTRKLVLEKIVEMVKATALTYGIEYEISKGTPGVVLVNDVELTQFSYRVAEQLIGQENVTLKNLQLMGSEDFAYYGKYKQTSYCFIGAGNNRAVPHHPDYDFDDQLILKGTAYWISLANTYLK